MYVVTNTLRGRVVSAGGERSHSGGERFYVSTDLQSAVYRVKTAVEAVGSIKWIVFSDSPHAGFAMSSARTALSIVSARL